MTLWMFDVRDFKVIFNSCIIATFTLCHFKNSYSSTCLLLMLSALNCRMMKGFPSEALVVIGNGSGCDVVGGGVEQQELHAQFLICR